MFLLSIIFRNFTYILKAIWFVLVDTIKELYQDLRSTLFVLVDKIEELYQPISESSLFYAGR